MEKMWKVTLCLELPSLFKNIIHPTTHPSEDVHYFQIKKALRNGCWLMYYCDKYSNSQQGMNISPTTKVLICFVDSHAEFGCCYMIYHVKLFIFIIACYFIIYFYF